MPTYQSFEELDCYRKCRKLRKWIYAFLQEKQISDHNIISNLSRAGRSTTRTIAEGFGRYHPKDNIRFCRMSIGSIQEVLDEFNILLDEEFCTESELKEGRILAYQAIKSTTGYIKYISSLIKKSD